MSTLITGGCGFIGSHLVRALLRLGEEVLNLDALTYAASPESLEDLTAHPRYHFYQGSILDASLLAQIFSTHDIQTVYHLAAETHVDRSITSPSLFLETNAFGTLRLLEASLKHYQKLPPNKKPHFRFLYVSTDEVYGALQNDDPPFTEESPYRPNNPYSASKASGDHLVRAFYKTYGLPCLLSHASNNYGPSQHAEKLIPLAIKHLRQGKPIPLYGDGTQIRDWLYVLDHVEALQIIMENGKIGASYNISAGNEKTNLDIAKSICQIFQRLRPSQELPKEPIRFIQDRPGHDFRYALSTDKIQRELGFVPKTSLSEGLESTVLAFLGPRPRP